jgi:hypothetical protein
LRPRKAASAEQIPPTAEETRRKGGEITRRVSQPRIDLFSMNCSAEEVAEDEAVLEAAEADSVAVEAAAEAVVSAAEDEAAAAARAASSESLTERCEETKLVPPDCPAILLGQYNYDCSFLFLTLCSVTNANAF